MGNDAMSSETERRRQQGGVNSALSEATSSMAAEKAQREVDDFNEAVAFVEEVTGDKYPGDLWDYLKDGRTLCKLANTLKPGIIKKVNKPGMPFKEMENLTMYINASKTLGVGGNTFRPPDLYEKRVSYPKAIVRNILALDRATAKTRSQSNGSSSPKTYAYQSARSSTPTPAPASSNSTSNTISVSVTSFSNDLDEPAPSRTTAHAPLQGQARTTSGGGTVTIGHYDSSSETERRRQQAAESSSVQGAPEWVKEAKNEQERADMLAAKTWMEAVTQEPFTNGDLWETTKTGVYLCKLINKIKPGTVKKYSKMSTNLPFKCMENINLYIEGCQKLGMRSGNTFRSPDLYEKRVSYPKAIINNIHALARIAEDLSGYNGPKLEVEIIRGNTY